MIEIESSVASATNQRPRRSRRSTSCMGDLEAISFRRMGAWESCG
jgi:hypothetical protein